MLQLKLMLQKTFAYIFLIIALLAVISVVVFLAKTSSHTSTQIQSGLSSSSGQLFQTTPTPQAKPRTKTNSYLGVPCTDNPNPKFTNDLTEIDKILKVTPNSLIASKSQDRVFLWIDTTKATKVPIYAPVDADLIKGVYKISRSIATIDYDLHFQVSCEVWFFINHISNPSDKIKKFFPKTPAANTASENFTQFSVPLHFSAGDLIGYTTGTAQAHNFDFAVFDLNHANTLIGQNGSTDSRLKNFICPFDLFPKNLKSDYYKKLDPSLIAESNCK